MDPAEALNAESHEFQLPRPNFYIGQHDSARTDTPTEEQYGQALNVGVSWCFRASPSVEKETNQKKKNPKEKTMDQYPDNSLL